MARGPGKPAPDHFNRRGRAATKLSGERHRGSRVVNKVPDLEAAGIGAQVDASAELRAGRDEISTIFSYKIGLPTASIGMYPGSNKVWIKFAQPVPILIVTLRIIFAVLNKGPYLPARCLGLRFDCEYEAVRSRNCRWRFLESMTDITFLLYYWVQKHV